MNIKRLFKQQYTGPLIGHLKLTYTYTAPYMNGMTWLMTTAILYRTTLQHHFYAKLGWAPGYLLFLLVLLCGYLVFGYFVRRFEMPSTMGVNMDQQLGFSKRWNKFERKVERIERVLLKRDIMRNKRKELRKVRYGQ